jgi:hypothetical protein
MAVILLPVYIAVTWQWVYISQYGAIFTCLSNKRDACLNTCCSDYKSLYVAPNECVVLWTCNICPSWPCCNVVSVLVHSNMMVLFTIPVSHCTYVAFTTSSPDLGNLSYLHKIAITLNY